MSCIVVDIELADRNFKLRVGNFLGWENSGTPILSSRIVQTHNTNLLVYKKFARNFVEQWMVGLQWVSHNFSKRCKSWTLCKKQKQESLGNLMDKEVEHLDDHGCPKLRDVVDPESNETMWILLKLPIQKQKPQFTVQSTRGNCLVTGQCRIWSC